MAASPTTPPTDGREAAPSPRGTALLVGAGLLMGVLGGVLAGLLRSPRSPADDGGPAGRTTQG